VKPIDDEAPPPGANVTTVTEASVALALPPPGAGVVTVTAALPPVAKSDAGTTAVRLLPDTSVVLSALPFNSTVETGWKPLPVMLRLSRGTIAATLGESEEIVGEG